MSKSLLCIVCNIADPERQDRGSAKRAKTKFLSKSMSSPYFVFATCADPRGGGDRGGPFPPTHTFDPPDKIMARMLIGNFLKFVLKGKLFMINDNNPSRLSSNNSYLKYD